MGGFRGRKGKGDRLMRKRGHKSERQLEGYIKGFGGRKEKG